MPAKKKFLLKDQLFNKEKVGKIAGEIARVYPSFTKDIFAREVVGKFPKLELKERIVWIAEGLKKYLPEEYPQAIKIILKALPPPNDPKLSDNDFGDFIYAPYGEFVAKNGCSKKYLKISLNALYEITKRFSAEDAIRYFLNTFPKETLAELYKWSRDKNYHVRRLTSEGTRPKLPWSQKINIPAEAPLIILENLFSDKTRFVTRSAANHLNDLSKISPDLTLATLARWQKSGRQKPAEMDFLIRHALRTLIKNGHSEALKMLGFNHSPKIVLTKFVTPKEVKINTTLNFSFSLKAPENTDILIDYILYFQNKQGELKNKKVFKLTKISLSKNKEVRVSKNHLLRGQMTTRTLYPGKHRLGIQINGQRVAAQNFVLKN